MGVRPRFQVVVSRESTDDVVEVHAELLEGIQDSPGRSPALMPPDKAWSIISGVRARTMKVS